MIGKFKNIINSNRPVLVDFYAEWCVPCKQIPPILKEVKEEFRQQLRIIKVDVDRNPNIATKYRIKSVPTMMLFKNGEAKWIGAGVRSVNELKLIVQQEIEN